MRFTNYDLRITIIVLLLSFIFLNPQSLIVNPALAQESTKSATPSSSLQDKLKALKDEIASKAASIKQEVNKKLQNKTYAGVIKTLNDKSITLSSKNGERIINLDEYTEFETGSKKPSVKDLKIDNYIVSLGDVDDKNTLVAKKIIKLDKTPKAKSIYFGTITSIKNPSLNLKTKEAEITVNTNNQTKISLAGAEANFSALAKNKTVIVTGEKLEQGMKASFIYIISSSPSAKN